MYNIQALGALREALKCVTKGRDINDKERKMEILQYRLELISKFVQARRIANTDPMEMFRICDELLMIRDVEVRVILKTCFVFLKIENSSQLFLITISTPFAKEIYLPSLLRHCTPTIVSTKLLPRYNGCGRESRTPVLIFT